MSILQRWQLVLLMVLFPSIVLAEDAVELGNGVPEAWTVGGRGDGRAGLSLLGLDAETVMRPNPGGVYPESLMSGGAMRQWVATKSTHDGVVVIDPKLSHSYGWSRGVGYAQLYVHVDTPLLAVLHLRQTGIRTSAWLDGAAVEVRSDPNPPAEFPKSHETPKVELEGLTTEGLSMTAVPEAAEPPRVVELRLSTGWHSLLVKMEMQHSMGESFFFCAKFTDTKNNPLVGLRTQTVDPTVDLPLHLAASRMRPLFFVENAPGNLPQSGNPLRIAVDYDWHSLREEKTLDKPIKPFRATLKLRLVSFDGREVNTREATGEFPGKYEFEFGPAPAPGYYAIFPTLYAPDGKLILANYPDGFTVTVGNAAQRERITKKKLWINNYYMMSDNADGRGLARPGELLNWLERSGVFKNLGSVPGCDPKFKQQWIEATRRGMVLFGDTAGDSKTMNLNKADGERCIQALADQTRYFKSFNEIDIQTEESSQRMREPKTWVERTKWEYEAVHRFRSDGYYLGGSLVRPGDTKQKPRSPKALNPGTWFIECLKLGIDQYQDAWDVHAYPQNPPRLGGPFGNSPIEDERGVLEAYKAVGRQNKLPFWYGEVGAKAAHCESGRRGQADLAAKMIAWVNHRADYVGIAFCIGNEYDWAYGRLWDYSMGHKPGEAAMITAGALIDGLPYVPVETPEPTIQVGKFGPTTMVWRLDNKSSKWPVTSEAGEDMVAVDVVGGVHPIELHNGKGEFAISSSPVYLLSRRDYDRLTRQE